MLLEYRLDRSMVPTSVQGERQAKRELPGGACAQQFLPAFLARRTAVSAAMPRSVGFRHDGKEALYAAGQRKSGTLRTESSGSIVRVVTRFFKRSAH